MSESGPDQDSAEAEQLRRELRDLRSRHAEVTSFLEAHREVMRQAGFAEAAKALFELCKRDIGATAGCVALRGRDGKHEHVLLDSGSRACAVEPGDGQGATTGDDGLATEEGHGLRDEVYRTGEAVCCNDFDAGERSGRLPPGHPKIDNVLFVPLTVAGSIVGVLGLANKPEGFGVRDVEWARGFADAAALALQHHRILESFAVAEKSFRSVAETARDAIITTDTHGRIVFWSHGAEAIFGYRAAEMLGQPVTRVIAPQQREDHERGLHLLHDAGLHSSGKRIDGLGLRRDGSEVPLEVSFASWTTAGGTCLTCVARDMSASRRAERALQLERSRFTAWSDALEDGVFVVNRRFEVEYANRVVVETFGPLEGRKCHEYFHGLAEPCPTCRTEVFSGKIAREEASLARTGRVYELFHAPLPNADGTFSKLGVFRDVTEQQRVAAERGGLEEQLRQAQKLEALGRLAGGVAHDFNNILTVVLCAAALLRQRLGSASGLQRDVQRIERAAKRAVSLTDQLLTFSRRDVTRHEVLDPNAVVGDMEGLLKPLIGEDIELRTRLAADLGHVEIDRGHLEQILANLVVNARDAMPDGGELLIATANAEVDEEFARCRLGMVAGGYVTLEVSDTGVGMSPDVVEHIFEPFFTTKPAGRGTGLGLATVHGIVHQAGGCVDVRTAPGQGSTFAVYLPRVDAPVDRPARGTPPPEGVAAPAVETILLAEDDEAVRSLARQTLEREGYTVLDCGSGEEALAVARTFVGRVDLLVSDLVMPGMNGRQLADHLRRLEPTVRLLYMSGYADDVVAQHRIAAENMPFLKKPFSPPQLLAKVREVLGGASGP